MPSPFDHAFPVPRDARAFGISIRTYIATQALNGLLAGDTEGAFDFKTAASSAVKMADALIKELNL